MSWQHFERSATDYAFARPPYPAAIFEVLRSERVIGPGLRVLEVGAGAGLATRELAASGSQVVALEPGPALCSLLEAAVPSGSSRSSTSCGGPDSRDAEPAPGALHKAEHGVVFEQMFE